MLVASAVLLKAVEVEEDESSALLGTHIQNCFTKEYLIPLPDQMGVKTSQSRVGGCWNVFYAQGRLPVIKSFGWPSFYLGVCGGNRVCLKQKEGKTTDWEFVLAAWGDGISGAFISNVNTGMSVYPSDGEQVLLGNLKDSSYCWRLSWKKVRIEASFE